MCMGVQSCIRLAFVSSLIVCSSTYQHPNSSSTSSSGRSMLYILCICIIQNIQFIFKCFLIVLLRMKKQQIILKNNQLKPQHILITIADPQLQEIPQFVIKIHRHHPQSHHHLTNSRKYIFYIEEIDQETPFMTQGDSYTFPLFKDPGTYHLKCLTFPKLSSVIQIQGDKRNSGIINLPGLQGLQAVQQEKQEELKDDNNARQQEMVWNSGEGLESPFGTPKKAEVSDFDKVLEKDSEEMNMQNVYLKYFKEQFQVWKNFFQKKQVEVSSPLTPKKEKPKSQTRKNSDSEEKIEESWTKRDKDSPYFTLSSGSPSNYENFSFDEKQPNRQLLYSEQQINDRGEQEEYEKIRTMKKTNSQIRLQIEQKDSQQTQTLSREPKYKQKKSNCVMEWVQKWSVQKSQVRIKRKEDGYLSKQYLQHLKNSNFVVYHRTQFISISLFMNMIIIGIINIQFKYLYIYIYSHQMGKVIRCQRKGKPGGVYRTPKSKRIAPPRYRNLDFAQRQGYIKGVVRSVVHDPGRGAPLLKVDFRDPYRFKHRTEYFLAAEGTYSGQYLFCGRKATVSVGNILPVNKITEGTTICNIESDVGDKGSYSRCSGTYATIVGHSEDGSRTRVRLPSGSRKTIPGNCRATVGIIAGGGRNEKPIMKAGVLFHKFKRLRKRFPQVAGVRMNPVDHPHGGGNHKHLGKPGTINRFASSGQKVGLIAARRTGLIRGTKKVKNVPQKI